MRRCSSALVVVLALVAGCDARYFDLAGPGAGTSAGPVVPELSDGPEHGVAAGTFTGRTGYEGAGSVTLVHTETGIATLVLGEDFFVSPVPAPVLLLTDRDELRGGKTKHELSLGVLHATAGPGRYPIGEDGGRRTVFVYCSTYELEVARATLVATP